MADYQGGGAFQPDRDINFTGQVNFVQTPSFGASGSANVVTTTGTQTLTNKTLSTPTVTAPVIAGAATVASGSIITTPTVVMTTSTGTATGATGGAGLALTAVTPQYVAATGASGAGLDLPGGATGAVGAVYVIRNMMTGVLNVYAVGGTINGTTGTTAYAITATGNKLATLFSVGAGVWIAGGNT